jgi:hypothetical protein
VFKLTTYQNSLGCKSIQIYNRRNTVLLSRERQEGVNMAIRKTVVKGYHECLFTVKLGEKFTAEKKRAERENAFKVVNVDKKLINN